MKKLETITFKQKKKSSIKRLTLGLFVLGFSALQAQDVQNNGSLFIGDEGIVYVGSGAFRFGSGGATETTRTTTTYGKLVFGTTATAADAANAHFLDGYASSSSAAFLFPVGQSGVYAPARVSASTGAVDVAYIATAPLVNTPDASVNEISTVEHWNIRGTGVTNITLTWRSDSNLADFGVDANLTNLTIVGFDGAKWVKIASTKDATSILGGTSTFAAGSITTNATVNLANYQYFTLASTKADCAVIVTPSGLRRTWDGTSWDGGLAPTLEDVAVISGATNSPGSFVCNSLVLNTDVTLTGTQSIEIVNEATGTGRIIMSSQSSVVQRASSAAAPNIVLTKSTRDTMRRFDYIYWGTPIAGNFFNQIDNAKASTATQAGAFDLKHYYETGTGIKRGWNTLTATEVGRGFITRIKEQAPFTNATNTDYINFTFEGVANNGDVTTSISYNPAAPDGGSSRDLLANPYPSAIDANKFMAENTAIGGNIYLWTSYTANNGTEKYQNKADYLIYNASGTVVPDGGTTTFDGKIASGQGFRVESLTNGTVTFNNCMRVTTGNTSFLKTKAKTAAAPKDRFKLNMKAASGEFLNQILIAYLPEATLGYDRLYDAGSFSVSPIQIFSLLEENGRKLAINGRPTFDASDIVPIGVSKDKASTGTAETFTISISDQEGVFTTQPVYIYDTVNNTYHDLSHGDFTLTADKTETNRYKVAYNSGTLSNPKFENNGVIAMMNNKTITLNASIPMQGIEVYDLTGRKILEAPINDALSSTTPFNFPKAVYIVKAKLNNGTVASFKLINKN